MADSLEIPSSYSSLPLTAISISHVPDSAPTATKVVQLTLNQPRKLNAVTEQTIEELLLAYKYFDSDDRVKAIVITGAGKAFCVGADLAAGFSRIRHILRAGPEARSAYRDGGGRVTLAIHNCKKPTIVAINGPAIGFGVTLTLAATIRVAYTDAKISFAFAQRGLVMEAASSYFLPRLIGMSRALHVVTTGATYSASDPLLNQLFSELLPTPEETLTRALDLAKEIVASTSVVSTVVMRHMMYRGPSSAEEAHHLDSKLFLSMLGMKDSEEGVKSFMEKRKPEFVGTMRDDAPLEWPWWNQANSTSGREPYETRGSKL